MKRNENDVGPTGTGRASVGWDGDRNEVATALLFIHSARF